MLTENSSLNADEQEEYIFKTLRESGSLAERPLWEYLKWKVACEPDRSKKSLACSVGPR